MLFLCLVAATLRFVSLSEQSIWYDEAISASLASHSVADLGVGRARDQGNPPLHVILLHGWTALFGTSEVALRSLSALLGTICVPLLFVVGRRLVGERAALIATALLAIAPFHVYFSQEARPYELVCVLGLLSTLALLHALECPGRFVAWAGHALFTFLAVYTHYFAAFLALAQLGYVLLQYRDERAQVVRALASFAAAGLCFTIWLPALYAQFTAPGNLSRSAESWPLHVVATPLVFSVGTTLVWKETATLWRLAAAAIAAISFGLPLVCGLLSTWRRGQAGRFLALWLVLPIAIPIAISLFLMPLYNVRYVILASLPFYLLVGVGLVELAPRLRAAVAAAIAATVIASLLSYYTGTFKHQWRDAVLYVEARAQPADLLLFDTDNNETSYAHYAIGPQRRLRMMPPPKSDAPRGLLFAAERAGGPTLDVGADIRTQRRLWLILSDVPPGTAERYSRVLGMAWTPVAGQAASFRGIQVLLLRRAD